MSTALYRKYRPQKLSEISGQNHIKTTLKNELELNRVAHAYLFSGPRGTGKTTIARILAKALNCEKRQSGEAEPCGMCTACEEITQGRALDVIEIDAASHTGVDNVRENIIQSSKYSPSRSKNKIFIIDEVHMLSISAFNALLKTLEEPPEHAYFILATTELYKVPETIVSRCQRFDFKKIQFEDLIERLSELVSREQVAVDKEVLELVARRSDGSVRDAESLLGQVLVLDAKQITLDLARLVIPFSDARLVLEFLGYLSQRQTRQALDLVNRIVYEGVNLERFTDDIIETLRRVLLLKLSDQASNLIFDLPKEQEKEIVTLTEALEAPAIVTALEVFLRRRLDFARTPIVQLPLELGIIEYMTLSQKTATPVAREPIASVPVQPLKSPEPIKPFSAKETPTAPPKTTKRSDQLIQVGASAGAVTLADVMTKWNEILLKIKPFNHTLFSFMRINKPIAVKDGVMQLAVAYSFHKERIDELRNRTAIEDIVFEVTGTRLRIECVIVEKQANQSRDDQDLEALAQEFGGSVLE